MSSKVEKIFLVQKNFSEMLESQRPILARGRQFKKKKKRKEKERKQPVSASITKFFLSTACPITCEL